MSEKKHELTLVFAALIISCFFLIYEVLDSPKYNSVEAYEITTVKAFTEQTQITATEKVNINTATLQELCTLEKIGEVKAAAIIEYREANGNFRSAEEIMQVSGISETIYNKNIDRITV